MSRVSVILPMRNAEPFVAAAVRSVLDQGESLLEVIVVDDGSTDRSAEVVKRIGDDRIRLIPGPRRGISAAVNAGIEVARGEILSRCDADDLFPAGRLARQVSFLDEHPEFAAVCGAFSTLDPTGRRLADLLSFRQPCEITDVLRAGQTPTHFGTYAVRADVVRSLQGFRTYFVSAEDIDFQLRLGQLHRVWYDPAPAYLYRLHDASITHSQADPVRRFYEETARVFQRQRIATGQDDLMRGTPPSPPQAGGHGPGASRQIQGMLMQTSWAEHRNGRRMRALWTGLRACMHYPANPTAWKSLAALALKRRGA